ncbi:DUF2334 domain-containing protein, partial [bacterium]|nr:DUF2334 domain-containing protein [bacterium]
MLGKVSRNGRRATFWVLAALLLVFCLISLPGWLNRIAFRNTDDVDPAVSLLPKVSRPVGVRFDPSYHYGKYRRPGDLATELAEQWRDAGVNLVFYRAYDPEHGAFYRTDYTLNEMDDFGELDLLSAVLRECHRRGIQVYAWIPVLNHGGAWKANPSWRSVRADGSEYRASSLDYPLCSWNPAAADWWLGLLQDLVSKYPDLDGLDLGEPVVSWREDEACHCDFCRKAAVDHPRLSRAGIRAEALTYLIRQSMAVAHRSGRRASVTFVHPVRASGDLESNERAMEITGLDLDTILAGGPDQRPDMICPEFLWQEHRSRLADKPGADVFTPMWTLGAVRQFMATVDAPVEVIAHLEMTDFPGVAVSESDLRASMRAAIQAGADGLDIYSSTILAEKDAWSALRNVGSLSVTRKCLVLHDGVEGLSDAVQVGEMLRHFDVEVTLRDVATYTSGTLSEFDNTFYVGVDWGNVVPAAFLRDMDRPGATSVCWLGFNIDQPLSVESVSNHLGLQYLTTVENQYNAVRYKGTDLTKEDPWTNVVNVFEPGRCVILATAQSEDGKTVPYAIRSGRNFWYFADVPPMFAIEGGRFLVFADLLHDILGEDHVEKRTALVRIEDVHPLSDPGALRSLADLLHGEDAPFMVGVVPYYVYPEENLYISLSEKPQVVSALQYMVRKGGTIVMHGSTHQRFAETTSDYEFWDPVSDSPPEGQNVETIRQKLEEGLREFWANELYPLMWETPHYAGSQLLYSHLPDYFSISMERRQSADRVGTDQYLPYLIRSDRFGQMIVPENLGYIPLGDARSEIITENTARMKVVRDGVPSFFFHPFIDHQILRKIVREAKTGGYTFGSIADLPIRVRTSFGEVTNIQGDLRVETAVLSGREGRLRFPGVPRETASVPPEESGVYDRQSALEGTDLYSLYFVPANRKRVTSNEVGAAGTPDDLGLLRSVSNEFGEECRKPIPLIVGGEIDPEADGWASVFVNFGIQSQRLRPQQFAIIPHPVNLVVVTEKAGRELTGAQIEMLVDSVSEDRVSLVASGFHGLADAIGIEKTSQTLEVREAQDVFYTGVEIHWKKPVSTFAFESPGEASFLYQDAGTETPLIISSPLGQGRFLFMGVGLVDEDGASSARFPHLLTHAFRALRLYPSTRIAHHEMYFNPADRGEEVSIEDLVMAWRREG